MKKLILFLLLLISSNLYSQEFVTDDNFKDKINSSHIVIVEFWAEFNQDNAFSEWSKIKGGPYYRVNITDAPSAKKKYRIRMAPTIIIFKEGDKNTIFKAGLDLLFPASLNDINEAIEEAKLADKF
tara:strand:- start:386 stop:763 length:378 start_codon:yes stop_codon:yes gene_type:complete